MNTAKIRWDREQALREMQRWCSTQERSHMDVRTKLIEHQVYGDILEEILADLISENFLNEMRYASAYVSGKFKINEWGRIKIIAGLKQKNISLKIITKAISEIDEHMYLKTLEKLYQNKKQLLKPKSLQDKQRLMNYLLQKGFEQHLIFEIMNKP
ncbi:MAG: hypothetical protein RLZZ546_118 [Bacteroidota bacterium]